MAIENVIENLSGRCRTLTSLPSAWCFARKITNMSCMMFNIFADYITYEPVKFWRVCGKSHIWIISHHAHVVQQFRKISAS